MQPTSPVSRRSLVAGFVLCGVLFSALGARADEQWLPMVPLDESRDAVVTIVNPNAFTIAPALTVLGDEGVPLPVVLIGDSGDPLPPGGSRRVTITLDEIDPEGPDVVIPRSVAVQVFSPDRILAWVESSPGGRRVAARSRSSIRARADLALPGFANAADGSVGTRIRIVNTSILPTAVDLTVRDSAGQSLGTFTVEELFPMASIGVMGDDLVADGVGDLFIESEQRVLAAMEVWSDSEGAEIVTSGSDAAENAQYWFPIWTGDNFDTTLILSDVAGGAGFAGLGIPFDARGTAVTSDVPITVTSGRVVERTLETLTGGETLRGVGALCVEITNGTAPRAPYVRVGRTGGDFAVLDPMRRIASGRSGFVPIPAADTAAVAEGILVLHAPDEQNAVGEVRLRDRDGRVLVRTRFVLRSMRTLALPLRRLVGRRGQEARVVEIVNPAVGTGKAARRGRRVVGGGVVQAALVMSSERIAARRPRGTGDLLAGYPAVQSPADLAPTVVAPEFLRADDDRRGLLTIDAVAANVGRRASIRVSSGETELGSFRVRVPGRGSIRLRLAARATGTRDRLSELWPVGEERSIVVVDGGTGRESLPVEVVRADPPEDPPDGPAAR